MPGDSLSFLGSLHLKVQPVGRLSVGMQFLTRIRCLKVEAGFTETLVLL